MYSRNMAHDDFFNTCDCGQRIVPGAYQCKGCRIGNIKKEDFMKLKFGLDFHGVIDSYPEFFKELSRMLVDNGHEIHIMTGSRKELAMKELRGTGVIWTHFFSITDHHESIGTEVTNDSNGNPHMPADVWNPVKAEYCKKHGIHMIIDDSPVYGKFFSEETGTIYAQILRLKKPKSNFNPRG